MIVTVLGFLLLIVVLLALGGGLLFLLAYGVGWVVNLVANFEPFQVTIISLASICAFGVLAVNIWNALTSTTRDMDDYDEFDYDDEYDDEYEDDEEMTRKMTNRHSSIPAFPAGGSRRNRWIFPKPSRMTAALAAVGASSRIVMARKRQNDHTEVA